MIGAYYRFQLETLKMRMLSGSLTYEQAKEEAQPIIDEMNKKAQEIARRYHRRHKKFTFSQLMR